MKIKWIWAFIGIIILGWIYYFYISPLIFKQKIIEVPNVDGLNELQAKEKLDDLKLRYNVNYIEGGSGLVKYTMPKCGTSVYLNSYIDLYIENNLPSYYKSFVGLMYDNNIDLIVNFCNEHNISYKTVYEVNNDYPSGQIFKQSKENDVIIEEFDELVIYIALSDDFLIMPDFTGMNIKQCIEILNEYNLLYNLIYYNTPLEEDIVIGQSIIAGSIVKRGNRHFFDIYISNGMPMDLYNIDVDNFINVLNEFNYYYDIIYVNSFIKNKLVKINDNKLYITK